jgi:hypothetical protein
METQKTITASSPEDKSIDGFISELEEEIQCSRLAAAEAATETWPGNGVARSQAPEERFRGLGIGVAKFRGNAKRKRKEPPAFLKSAQEPAISPANKILDEISFVGEAVGFAAGVFIRFVGGSLLTGFVVALFGLIVFLHAFGKGFVRKRWDIASMRGEMNS